MRIAVFNTFDIAPGHGGGEIRLQNLYRRLSRTNDVRFLSYDINCTVPIRRSRLSPALDLITTAVSEADRSAFFGAWDQTGRYPHDVMCVSRYEFTPVFLAEVSAALAWAQVVVVTHPYLSGLIIPQCQSHHLKIYEAHNNELRVKTEHFAGSRNPGLGDQFVADTRRCEALALESADIVLTVSDGDAESFVVDYDVRRTKLQVVPNGVSVAPFDSIPLAAKHGFRQAAGLASRDVGVFLGSSYGPNVDSYRLIRMWLDEAKFTGSVLIVGRIVDAYSSSWPRVSFNEHWLGFVDDTVKRLVVSASDFALQIVTSGGGTNLKLFDYMAAGVPILANVFGARGVAEDGWFIPVDSPEAMKEVILSRRWRSREAMTAAAAAHGIALRTFDWERIADKYQAILA
jgi:glycosyltransferase involved in cell wall biosynthesis